MKIRLAAALAAIIIVNLVAPAAFAGPLDAALRGFGTSGAQTKLSARSSHAPIGFQIYCLRHRADCRGGGKSVLAYTPKLASTLRHVNHSINKSIRYRSDRGDVWRANVNTGDCEDYVLTKRKQLIRMGVSASALRIASVKTRRGEGHAVLVVRTSKGELILDNARQQILPRHKTGYRWMAMSSSNPQRWSAQF